MIVYKGARRAVVGGSYDDVLCKRTIRTREMDAAVVKVRMKESTENKGMVTVER